MKVKKITFEFPEDTYLIDMVYYRRIGNGVSKAEGIFSESVLTDGNDIQAWSNTWFKTEERNDGNE